MPRHPKYIENISCSAWPIAIASICNQGGKSMLIYRASTLPNLEGSYAVVVELYGNGRNVQFLVVATAILALTRRYYRLFTGTIDELGLGLGTRGIKDPLPGFRIQSHLRPPDSTCVYPQNDFSQQFASWSNWRWYISGV